MLLLLFFCSCMFHSNRHIARPVRFWIGYFLKILISLARPCGIYFVQCQCFHVKDEDARVTVNGLTLLCNLG